MAERNVRTSFSMEEYHQLRDLVIQKVNADSTKQKGIRAKMRNMGFYWDEVGEGNKFTLPNFEFLFTSGKLKIIGNNGPIQISATETSLAAPKASSTVSKIGGRANSDEFYVIDLCDEVLGQKAQRQHRFDFLKGDNGHPLPVDAYYEDLNLVVEFYERQHTEVVNFFDNKMTASGVTRGEQRKIYDQRRAEVLPQHGIKLVIISYSDFGTSKKLKRNYNHDIEVLRSILK